MRLYTCLSSCFLAATVERRCVNQRFSESYLLHVGLCRTADCRMQQSIAFRLLSRVLVSCMPWSGLWQSLSRISYKMCMLYQWIVNRVPTKLFQRHTSHCLLEESPQAHLWHDWTRQISGQRKHGKPRCSLRYRPPWWEHAASISCYTFMYDTHAFRASPASGVISLICNIVSFAEHTGSQSTLILRDV